MDQATVNMPAMLTACILVLLYIMYKIGDRRYKEFEHRNMVYQKPSLIETITHQLISSRRVLQEPTDYYYKKFKGHRAFGFFHYHVPCVYVMDPDVLRLIFATDFDSFQYHHQYYVDGDETLFAKLIFSSRGERWKQLRTSISPAFTLSKMKNHMYDIVKRRCEFMANHLQERCSVSGRKDGLIVSEMLDLYEPFSLDTMAEVGFGFTENSLVEGGSELSRTFKQGAAMDGFIGLKFQLATVFPYLLHLLGIDVEPRNVTNLCQKIVKNLKESLEKSKLQAPTIFYFLTEAQKKQHQLEAEAGKKETRGDKSREITDFDLAANVFNFLAGSYDATGSAHSAISYLFALNPDVQERARQEVETILAQDGGQLTYEGIQRMKYLENAVYEAHRLLPSSTTTDRTCTKDYVVPATGSHPAITFKKGDMVLIPSMAIQRDPAFFENPDRFDPDRWNEKNKHKIDPFTFLPFGAGPRYCIAAQYVYMESRILFATLLPKFTFERIDKTPAKINVTINALYVMNNRDFWVGIKPRVKSVHQTSPVIQED